MWVNLVSVGYFLMKEKRRYILKRKYVSKWNYLCSLLLNWDLFERHFCTIVAGCGYQKYEYVLLWLKKTQPMHRMHRGICKIILTIVQYYNKPRALYFMSFKEILMLSLKEILYMFVKEILYINLKILYVHGPLSNNCSTYLGHVFFHLNVLLIFLWLWPLW